MNFGIFVVEIVNSLLWLFLRLNLVFIMFDQFGILISFIYYWWLLRCICPEKLGLVLFLTLDLVVGCMISILRLSKFNARRQTILKYKPKYYKFHINNLNVFILNSSGWRYRNVIELVYLMLFYPISPHMGLGTRKV